jgi:hypothetical protein
VRLAAPRPKILEKWPKNLQFFLDFFKTDKTDKTENSKNLKFGKKLKKFKFFGFFLKFQNSKTRFWQIES